MIFQLLLDYEDTFRICSHCGAVMYDGFFVAMFPEEYYCSDDCLHEHYTEQEYLEMHKNDDAFYTQWS